MIDASDSTGIPAAVAADARLDDSELAARLRLVVNRLARLLRSQAPADLSPSLTSALVTIELRGSITLGRLAACERVTPPSVTRMVASLEKRGLVRREADPADRRVARVSLTADGKRTVLRSRTRKTAFLAKQLRKLDESELGAMREALPVLERLLEDNR
jgi:DNA-binding MarR family transcriptional regulator